MLSKPGEDEQEELNLRQKGQRGDKFRGHCCWQLEELSNSQAKLEKKTHKTLQVVKDNRITLLKQTKQVKTSGPLHQKL